MSILENYYKDKLCLKIQGFQFDDKMDHIFSSRIGWDQNELFDDLAEVWNISDKNIYKARQVHGTSIKIIKEEDSNSISREEKDGFITNEVGLALCTYHADCAPIYFYDNIKKVIGLAHAGWKGTLGNIVKEIIENMVKTFDSNIKDIKVGIGPSIGKCCYEIGQDVEILFSEKYHENLQIMQKIDNKIFLDISKTNIVNLLNMGINKNNIFTSNTCTACNLDKLYSYRKENGTKSRMIASIIMKS